MIFSDTNLWIISLVVLDLVLVIAVLLFIRSMKSGLRRQAAMEASRQLMEKIEPLIKETDSVAKAFEEQLKEKKLLVNQLNKDLDSRIISMNMLLNRAKSYMDDEAGNADAAGQVYKQQEAILDLYAQRHDAESIAKKLAMPKGEVELVIDLKRKFT